MLALTLATSLMMQAMAPTPSPFALDRCLSVKMDQSTRQGVKLTYGIGLLGAGALTAAAATAGGIAEARGGVVAVPTSAMVVAGIVQLGLGAYLYGTADSRLTSIKKRRCLF